MGTNVDPNKVEELSVEFKRLSRIIEDGETSVNKDIMGLIQETNSQYTESYVRSTTSEMESLLKEIRILAVSITERLNDKSNVLKRAAEQYRHDEEEARKQLQKPVGFSLSRSIGGAFGAFFKKFGKAIVAVANKALDFIFGKGKNKYHEPTLDLPLDVASLKANLSMNTNVYREEVKRLQQKLKDLGYDIEVDGYFGKQTLGVVNSYKDKYGLANTGKYNGVVDGQMWLYLFGSLSGELKLSLEKYSEMVKMAQIRLKDLGYNVEITGYFDEKTFKVVNEFKENNKLGNEGKWEGVIGPQTWDVLFSSVPASNISSENNTNSIENIIENSEIIDVDILQDYINKYVNFTLTDANGNSSEKIQLPYKWGGSGGVGKWSYEEIISNISKLGLDANSPDLQSKITSNLSKTGIDCSGLVLQIIDKSTNGKATEYYKNYFNIPGNNVLHYGVSADNLTSSQCSTQITKLSDIKPGDYIRFDNGDHIGIIYKVDGNMIYYAHSSGSKGPHMATITVTENGEDGLNLSKKSNATFNDWDKKYSASIQGLFNYICRPKFVTGKDPDTNIGTPIQGKNEILKGDVNTLAIQIINSNEGNMGSVNRDDNGALSIGKIQWHAERAFDLMVKILKKLGINKDDKDFAEKAAKYLPSSIYNDLQGDRSCWHRRTVTKDEAKAISELLVTSQGKEAQNETVAVDVPGYISHGKKLGITDSKALIYFADLENQGGAKASARIVKAAGGGEGLTLDEIYDAALTDKVMGQYENRRKSTYDKCNEFDI